MLRLLATLHTTPMPRSMNHLLQIRATTQYTAEVVHAFIPSDDASLIVRSWSTITSSLWSIWSKRSLSLTRCRHQISPRKFYCKSTRWGSSCDGRTRAATTSSVQPHAITSASTHSISTIAHLLSRPAAQPVGVAACFQEKGTRRSTLAVAAARGCAPRCPSGVQVFCQNNHANYAP